MNIHTTYTLPHTNILRYTDTDTTHMSHTYIDTHTNIHTYTYIHTLHMYRNTYTSTLYTSTCKQVHTQNEKNVNVTNTSVDAEVTHGHIPSAPGTPLTVHS